MAHPYSTLPDKHWWRRSVVGYDPGQWPDLYQPRFKISPEDKIATAGSCFAQHIGRNLKKRGYRYTDYEPPPAFLPKESREKFGYGIYSARFGNIYTARQLSQLLKRVRGKFVPVDNCWEHKGRYYDPYRPTLEPDGFASPSELFEMQKSHLYAVRRMIKKSNIFVFTLGLTETWLNKKDGAAYPVCPGTTAGKFDPDSHVFHNFTYGEVLADMEDFIRVARRMNPKLRFLLTVSPVPLIATASDKHVLLATTYSKSVLRAVAGDLAAKHDFIDYFPSYEIITAPASKGVFYASDQREVTPEGVAQVMSCFFGAHGDGDVNPRRSRRRVGRARVSDAGDKVICDEEKLEKVICDEEKLEKVICDEEKLEKIA